MVVCPEPSTPWQVAQRSRKLSRASFRSAGVAVQGFVSRRALRGIARLRAARATTVSMYEGSAAVLKPRVIRWAA